MHFQYHDFRDHSFPKNFDGCLMIDVIEHIFPKEQDKFMKTYAALLKQMQYVLLALLILHLINMQVSIQKWLM